MMICFSGATVQIEPRPPHFEVSRSRAIKCKHPVGPIWTRAWIVSFLHRTPSTLHKTEFEFTIAEIKQPHNHARPPRLASDNDMWSKSPSPLFLLLLLLLILIRRLVVVLLLLFLLLRLLQGISGNIRIKLSYHQVLKWQNRAPESQYDTQLQCACRVICCWYLIKCMESRVI